MNKSSVRDAWATAARRGFVAAVVGALAGAVGGGLTVGGTAFALMSCEGTGFDCLGVALLAMAVGVLAALAASVGGCYWALKLRGHERAGRTAGFMAALLPAAGFVSVVLAGALTIFGPVFGIAAAAIVARRLAIGKAAAPRAPSNAPSDVLEKGTV